MPRNAPGPYVPLRRGHCLTNGLIFVTLPMGGDGENRVDKVRGSFISNASLQSNIYGRTWRFANAVSDAVRWPAGYIPLASGTSDVTIMVFCNPVTSAVGNPLYAFSLRNGGGSFNWLTIGINSDKTNTLTAGKVCGMEFVNPTFRGADTANTVLTAAATWNVLAYRRLNGTARSIWVNGVDATATSDNGAALDVSTGTVVTIGDIPGGFGRSPGCDIAVAAMWNRALSDSEMAQIGADPFAMFRPQHDWILKSSAAGFVAVNRRSVGPRVGSRSYY